MLPDGCVLDYGNPNDCIHAKQGMKREECQHWLPCDQTKEGRQVEALRSALERTLTNFKALLGSKPVRDAAETIAEAESALRM